MSSAARAIVEIQGGQLSSRKATIAPGGTLRVGRAEPSDFLVPHDQQLSGVHFELSWDGEHCRLRHLTNRSTTWLDGQQVSAGDVENGSWIRAGDTIFLVHFEGATVRRFTQESSEKDARKRSALVALRSEPEPLFALLDAAREARVLTLLRHSAEKQQSLFEGVMGEALANVAPYLVSLPRESSLLDSLVREGWQNSWGVYATSRRPFDEVRQHFRRLLSASSAEPGRRRYFRFYDPRVLRSFLPRCTGRQRATTFGEMECFVMEGESGEVVRFEATKVSQAPS